MDFAPSLLFYLVVIQNLNISESCTGVFYDGYCFWLTPTTQNIAAGETVCQQDDAHVTLLPSTFTLTEVYLLAQQLDLLIPNSLEAFIGYEENGPDIQQLDGVTIPTSTSLYDSLITVMDGDVNTQRCFGFTATGLISYHCSESRLSICSNFSESVGTSTTQATPSTIIATASATTTATTTTPEQGACLCLSNYTQYTRESLAAYLEELKKALSVNKKELSSTVRQKTCASDSRPSSIVMGSTGIIIIVVVIAGVVFLDLPNLHRCLTSAKQRIHKPPKSKVDPESDGDTSSIHHIID